MSKPRTPKRSIFLTASQLKERGWTNTLIKTFLGDPDKTDTNPHYQCAAPMRLYSLLRIERAERGKRFITAMAVAARRKESSQRAVETKREKLRQYLETVVIEVPLLEMAELKRVALDHWEAIRRHDWEAGESPAWEDKITVNYLRHELTRYEEELEAIAGKVGAREAYLEIAQKVFNAISDAYPHLSGECDRQMEKKWAHELASAAACRDIVFRRSQQRLQLT